MAAVAASRSLRLELACFAALAGFAGLEWVSLVADPPVLRIAVTVAIATAAGVALVALGRARLGRGGRMALGVAAVLAATVAAMVAIGLPARLLLAWNWDELSTALGQSLQGISDISVPYGGADGWTRLTILLGAPLGIGLAAAAAFWPGQRRNARWLAALVVLLALYLSANAWSRPGGDFGRGLLLCVLVCAWLWLPKLAPSRRGGAVLAIATAAAVALPLAAALAPDKALLDYRSWRLLSQEGVNFGWAHSYGPLDWPQKGTRVLTVASEEPHYWKATTLDEFDGFGWRRSDALQPEPVLGTPAALQNTATPGDAIAHPEWIDRLNFDVRGLSSDVVVGAGTVLSVRNVDASPSPDATWVTDETLESGDEYTVLAYLPDPSETQLRASSPDYPEEASRYTALTIPGVDRVGTASAEVPLWGKQRQGESPSELFRGTPYEQTYDLATRVTSGAATPHDAVTRIESYLRGTYTYDQNPPEHGDPLPAFLFEDRRGYCQQFSGAMALMLRMIGIPARVASGFAPGGRDPDRGTFLVEDVDAHAWVEVYFTGIGWVPFEPTPAAAPAESQLSDTATTDPASDTEVTTIDAAPTQSSDSGGGGDGGGRTQALAPGSADGGGSGPGGTEIIAAVALAAALAVSGLYAIRTLRRRRLGPESLAAAELGELERALARLDRPLPAGATLLDAGRRLEGLAGPAGARYAASLRERRYRRPSAPPPGVGERRTVRRALLAARGWRGAAATLRAIPPGGPRRLR
ncbi:MAG TPA: transglutaminase-like domain-containing protein [Solirubrobacterales bacterium]|jgi:transglutaminase-like putative cysteine protease|nr:transglutaminase-like domain-containing protein [Solirubrobacterales bacterium]